MKTKVKKILQKWFMQDGREAAYCLLHNGYFMWDWIENVEETSEN